MFSGLQSDQSEGFDDRGGATVRASLYAAVELGPPPPALELRFFPHAVTSLVKYPDLMTRNP